MPAALLGNFGTLSRGGHIEKGNKKAGKPIVKKWSKITPINRLINGLVITQVINGVKCFCPKNCFRWENSTWNWSLPFSYAEIGFLSPWLLCPAGTWRRFGKNPRCIERKVGRKELIVIFMEFVQRIAPTPKTKLRQKSMGFLMFFIWGFISLLLRNLTWNLKIMVSKRIPLFQGLLFRFHVKFQRCNPYFSWGVLWAPYLLVVRI